MQTHHNRRLLDLSLRNLQRRNLESLLAGGAMKSWFEASSLIYHPDTPRTVVSAFYRAQRMHCQSESELGIEIHETSSKMRANEWLKERLNNLPNGQYYLGFGRAVHQSFDANMVWAPKYPILLTSPQVIVENLHGLLKASDDFIVTVKSDGGAGVVMDSHGGYLPEEPSPEEIVYELTAWGSDA
jgi:hypothetical protein